MRSVRAVFGCVALLCLIAFSIAPASASETQSASDPAPALAALDTITKDEWLSQPSSVLLERVVAASSWGALYTAARSDTRAQTLVGVANHLGQHTIQTNIGAAKFYLMAAGENPIAQNNLGSLLMTGYAGVKPDPATAAKYFKLAADQGHPVAQMNLGMLYRDGTGVSQDLNEAERLLKLAAKSGKADALYHFATVEAALYGDEVDAFEYVQQQFDNAFDAYKRDAEAGAYPLRRMAEMIFNGEAPFGTTGEEGFAYVQKAAALGDTDAKFRVARCYDEGRGVAKDQAKAAALYKELVAIGYTLAYANLGVLYEKGTGVAADKAEAIRLYKLGAARGDASASEHLKRLGETG